MLKKIAILLIVLCLVVGISLQVKATNTDFNLDDLLNNSLTNDSATNTVQNETNNGTLNVTTNTEGNGIIQPDINSESTSGNDLPQTGVTEDITVMFFIVVCAIVSIYAYKKIRDYKA